MHVCTSEWNQVTPYTFTNPPFSTLCSPSPHMWGGGAAPLPNERGQRSGTPRSFENEQQYNNYMKSNYNDHYEGDEMPIPNLHLGDSQSDRTSDKDPYSPTSSGQQHTGENMRQFGRNSYENDTDSESEFTEHQKQFGMKVYTKPLWLRIFDYLKSGMPPQQQERMDIVLQGRESTHYGHVLLLLQLIGILAVGALVQSLQMGISVGQLSFGLWRCKFQLRSFQRQLLWRMANAKGNDVIIFLGIMLITPWLFLTSLIGFIVSLLFFIKEGLGKVLLQVRLFMFN